jgi:hypothetical protein
MHPFGMDLYIYIQHMKALGLRQQNSTPDKIVSAETIPRRHQYLYPLILHNK